MSDSMYAVTISSPGDAGVLQWTERPLPEPGPGEIRIRVIAAGVNRPDIIQREGRYPAPPGVPADIPGLEVSGFVDSCGKEARQYSPGDKVCALLAGGGYAEYVVVPEVQCLPVPKSISLEEAASLPETFFTVWTNIFDRANFTPGETVLIHGGSSGIGTAAIQMVSAMGGKVCITAGTKEKCDYCTSLGADLSINYREETFETRVREFGGADIILDMIGGNYTPRNLQCLKEEGRLVIINAMQGNLAEIDLMRIMVKRQVITGSTLRTRDPAFKGRIARHLKQYIWPFLENGTIRPIIFATFSMQDASYAHRLMESGQHMGKIVLVAPLSPHPSSSKDL